MEFVFYMFMVLEVVVIFVLLIMVFLGVFVLIIKVMVWVIDLFGVIVGMGCVSVVEFIIDI